MRIYSAPFSAIKLILLIFASGSGYAAVRLENMMGLALAYIGSSFIFILWTVLSLMGGLHIESAKLLRNLEQWSATNPDSRMLGCANRNRKKWFDKSVKSMRPLRVGVVHFYVIKKASLLIVLKIISENIVFLLVNF